MNKFLNYTSILFATALMFLTFQANAHTKLLAPEPRVANDNLKVTPCGNIAKAAPKLTLRSGQQYLVRFEETINHTGYFWIDLALDDQSLLNFNPNDANPNNNNRANVWVLSPPPPGNIPDNIIRGEVQYLVTIPAEVSCANCTLRVVQYMMENLAQPYYYSCADVQILPANIIPPPPGDGSSDQSSLSGSNSKPAFGGMGCGLVSGITSGSGKGPKQGPPNALMIMLFFAFPLFMLALFKVRQGTLREVPFVDKQKY